MRGRNLSKKGKGEKKMGSTKNDEKSRERTGEDRELCFEHTLTELGNPADHRQFQIPTAPRGTSAREKKRQLEASQRQSGVRGRDIRLNALSRYGNRGRHRQKPQRRGGKENRQKRVLHELVPKVKEHQKGEQERITIGWVFSSNKCSVGPSEGLTKNVSNRGSLKHQAYTHGNRPGHARDVQ